MGPPWLNLPLELRALPERIALPLLGQRLTLPRGHGQPVLLLPGFGQSDTDLSALAKVLRRQDFRPETWQLGRNLGLRPGMTGQLLGTIARLADDSGQSVSLIGWSLGGIFARELARKRPDSIARVISLGSPISGGDNTTIQPLFRLVTRQPRPATQGPAPDRTNPPPVPCTAVYSRSDGIVNWRAAREIKGERVENIAVRGSHMAMGYNPLCWYVCAHRIAHPDKAFAWPAAWRRWLPSD